MILAGPVPCRLCSHFLNFSHYACPSMCALLLQDLLNDFEFQYLLLLADPVRAVTTMLVARLLSNHSKDEEYLSEPQSPWLTVR